MHYYEAEIEIPDNLFYEDEVDWVVNNTDDCILTNSRIVYISTDWDSFVVEDVDNDGF